MLQFSDPSQFNEIMNKGMAMECNHRDNEFISQSLFPLHALWEEQSWLWMIHSRPCKHEDNQNVLGVADQCILHMS